MDAPAASAAGGGGDRWHPDDPRTRRVVLLAISAVVLVGALVVPTYPNYDSYFHLDWGRELLGGHLPHVQAYAAPTEHPGFLAACTLLDLVFGGWADRALVLLCFGALVMLATGAFRVGSACFGPWPGVFSGLFTLSSFAFLLYAARGYVDVPFLALVLWAAALEAERAAGGRDRRRTVGILLALGGLLRPEAWILGGLHWLWRSGACQRGQTPLARLRAALADPELLVLSLVAPLAWSAWDLVLTGDPLFSLHATSTLADELGRERGLGHVPRSFVSFLADTARPPVFAAALLGTGLAWWQRVRLRALHVPVALFAAGAITFVGTGVGGLSILPRYLTVPAVSLCVVAGFAVAGFTRLPAGRERTLWTRGALGAVLVGLVFLVLKAGSFAALARELRFIDRTHKAVVALSHDHDVAGARLVTLPNYRLIPDLRFALDWPERRIRARSQVGQDAGAPAVFVVGGSKPIHRFGEAAGVSNRFNAPGDYACTKPHDFLAACFKLAGG